MGWLRVLLLLLVSLVLLLLLDKAMCRHTPIQGALGSAKHHETLGNVQDNVQVAVLKNTCESVGFLVDRRKCVFYKARHDS